MAPTSPTLPKVCWELSSGPAGFDSRELDKHFRGEKLLFGFLMMMLRSVHCRLEEFGLDGGRVRRELTNPFYSVSCFEELIAQPLF